MYFSKLCVALFAFTGVSVLPASTEPLSFIEKDSLFKCMDNTNSTAEADTDRILAAHQPLLMQLTNSPFINVLKMLGYRTEAQQAAYVKLMAITDVLPSEIAEDYPTHRLLTDEEGTRVLELLAFTDESEAFNYLLTVTQQKWRRNSHFKEGANGNPDNKIARWFTQDTGALETHSAELEKIAKTLGFVDGSSWTESRRPDEILLMGGLEQHIVERLCALTKLKDWLPLGPKIRLSYLTGARGVFNFEPSLAPMLAQDWFGDPSLESAIQHVLDEHSQGWGHGRTRQLQLLILAAIGALDHETTDKLVRELDNGSNPLDAQSVLQRYWPQGIGFYYHSPEKYDDQTTGWPVAADLVAYHLKMMQMHEPWYYGNIELVPVVAEGKDGRVANTGDTIERWVKDFGADLRETLKNEGRRPLIASLSSQPHTLYMHETARKLLRPLEWQVITVSVPATEVKLTTILDVATRLLFTTQDEIHQTAAILIRSKHPKCLDSILPFEYNFVN